MKQPGGCVAHFKELLHTDSLTRSLSSSRQGVWSPVTFWLSWRIQRHPSSFSARVPSEGEQKAQSPLWLSSRSVLPACFISPASLLLYFVHSKHLSHTGVHLLQFSSFLTFISIALVVLHIFQIFSRYPLRFTSLSFVLCLCHQHHPIRTDWFLWFVKAVAYLIQLSACSLLLLSEYYCGQNVQQPCVVT